MSPNCEKVGQKIVKKLPKSCQKICLILKKGWKMGRSRGKISVDQRPKVEGQKPKKEG
jgi:hypothetical protein